MSEFKKITVIQSIDGAQSMTKSPHTSQETEFFSDLFEQFDDIAQGDKVRVVGQDKYKGHIGLIVRTYITEHNQHMFTIQLQTTGKTIDRSKTNLKRYY